MEHWLYYGLDAIGKTLFPWKFNAEPTGKNSFFYWKTEKGRYLVFELRSC